MLGLLTLQTAVSQLRSNPLRTLLTMLGIVISVTSTICVITVLEGFTGFVSDQLRGFGTNAIWIWPERPDTTAGAKLGKVELNLDDILAITNDCSSVALVSPLIRRPLTSIRFRSHEIRTLIEAVSTDYLAIRKFTISSGRRFGYLEEAQSQAVCLLGHEIAEKLEITETNLGESLWIDGQRFRIEGILEEKGAFFGMSQDDLVLIPYTSGLKLYPSLENKLAVNVSATHEDSVAEAKSQIISVLRRQHRLGPEQPNDFQIRTQGEILKIFENVSLAALVVLTGIVGISLLVGGIGIMNVMLVSVTERTREIGLRKAVGARRRDILGQFLTEAMALSLLGGLLGILIAYGLTTLASLHPKMIAIKVPFWSLGVGFGISAFTGIFFGMLPALKAALLNPIDALRHE